MKPGTACPLPSRLSQVRAEFEKWRRTRRSRGRIPEALWSSAVEVASEFGVCRAATALRLNVESLRKRMGSPTATEVPAVSAASFVEVLRPTGSRDGEFVLELENAQGSKMRIVLKGDGAPNVDTLVERFWQSAS